jgi:succinate dehydrogenase/fumarate reductase-like Fe-S protein
MTLFYVCRTSVCGSCVSPMGPAVLLFCLQTAHPVHQKYLITVFEFTWTGATVVMTLGSLAL